MKKPFPPSDRLLADNLRRISLPKRSLETGTIPLLHVTSVDRVESIIRSGRLLSISTQESIGISHDRMDVNTDKLDRKLGLDNYVFATLGRNAFHNGGTVSFVFPSKDIIRASGVIGSLKEIADYGALVSREAEELFLITGGDPTKQNKIATKKFMDGIIAGKDFLRVFEWFLGRFYVQYLDYLVAATYPGETFEFNELGTTNFWGGPQVMVPESISLEKCIHIVTRTQSETQYILSLLEGAKLQIPVRSLEEQALKQGIARLPPEQTNNFIYGMNILTNSII